MERITKSELETMQLAEKLAQSLEPGDVLALQGELGGGKTTFIKGIAKGLDIPSNDISSPSYTLLHIYNRGKLILYHLDLFRLANVEEIEHLGLLEQTYDDGIVAIEWADRLGNWIPANALHIQFNIISETTRSIWVFGPERLTKAFLNNE